MAALAVVIMSLGGLIPVATFVCPVLCMMILAFVLKMCGKRIAWAWYGAVSILSVLLGPDKEAAAVFVFLGFYPILKLLLFNAAILVMYGILIRLFGMEQIASEYREMGRIMTGVMLVLGNITFFLLDKVLSRFQRIK